MAKVPPPPPVRHGRQRSAEGQVKPRTRKTEPIPRRRSAKSQLGVVAAAEEEEALVVVVLLLVAGEAAVPTAALVAEVSPAVAVGAVAPLPASAVAHPVRCNTPQSWHAFATQWVSEKHSGTS